MAIESTEIKFRLSGGAANADPAASLGGAVSSVDASFNTLFPTVTSAQAAAGLVAYRCVYLKNIDPVLTGEAMKVWIQANTPNAATTLDIGLGAAAINAEETAVANGTTAPAGVTFSAAANEAAALAVGNLVADGVKAIWLRLTVTAGAVGPFSDTFTLRAKCDTAT